MFDLKAIKKGMNYKDIRRTLRKADNIKESCLPAFCSSAYEVIENLNTKEKVYFLQDHETGIILDVTDDYSKVVALDNERGEEHEHE